MSFLARKSAAAQSFTAKSRPVRYALKKKFDTVKLQIRCEKFCISVETNESTRKKEFEKIIIEVNGTSLSEN